MLTMYHSECLWNTTPGHSEVKNANTDSSNYYSNNKHTATSNIYNMTAYAKYYFTIQWLKHFTKLKLLFLTLRQIYHQYSHQLKKNELIFLRKLSALWDSM